MTKQKKVQLCLFIPERLRERLRVLAAQRNIQNPEQEITGAGLAAEIVCAYLKNLENEQNEKEDRIYE